jgi:hypothetical protein
MSMPLDVSLDRAYVELRFRPNVRLVTVVRRFVSEFYQRTLIDPDGCSRVAMATHELLENAVKYSTDGETLIRIEMADAVTRTVSITLRNRATPAHVAALREIVDGMAAAPDAFEYYQQVIADRVRRKEGSGLGLVRICAEGEMTVRLAVANDAVELVATTQVGAAA